MPRRKPADPPLVEGLVTCAASECSNTFEAKRRDQRYCSKTCRQRASRARKAAEAAAEIDAKAEAGEGGAEHDLVRSVRKELGDAAETVLGQLALQLSRRMADPKISGFSALSRELRSLLVEAKASTPGGEGPAPDGGPAPEPDDEVTRARRAREEARQAAGRP